MKVYWNDKYRKGEILEDIEKNRAQPWDTKEPKSHILIGKDQMFINPTDYGIDGYSLSVEDLEELLQKIRNRADV